MESLDVKTANILAELPSSTSKETLVLVNLVRLLLEQSKEQSQELTTLRSVVEVQRNVSENFIVENKRLRDNLKTLDDRFNVLAEKVDENEQHGRNVNLILKGVPEDTEREDTTKKFINAINEHYKNDKHLKTSDIKRSHRLGKRKPGQTHPRPIIARFSLETTKMDIFRGKKVLAGKGISLAENLTSYRAGIYKKARDLL